jgi:hypothetical protein
MVGIIAAVLVLGGVSASAQDPQRSAAAEELLKVMNVQDAIEKSFAMVKKMIPAQMEKMTQMAGETNMPANVSRQTDKMLDMISVEFSWDKIKADYIALYADTFTEQEIKDMIAFYKSPVGQALVKKQPELMKRSMEISQKVMMQIMPKIQAMAEDAEKTAPASDKQK